MALDTQQHAPVFGFFGFDADRHTDAFGMPAYPQSCRADSGAGQLIPSCASSAGLVPTAPSSSAAQQQDPPVALGLSGAKHCALLMP